MLKKIIYLSVLFTLISCSSNNGTTDPLENKNNLEYFLESKNIAGVKRLSKYFLETKLWLEAYKAYAFLCLNEVDTDSYCNLMWATVLKTHNESKIFEAAAINFNLYKTPYWFNELVQATSSSTQRLIVKLLQNKLLTDREINSLVDYQTHYAQALMIKGKKTLHLPSLKLASEIYISLQQWRLVADAFVLSSNIALMNNEMEKAKGFYYEALIYYELALSPVKIKELLSWGRSHGFTG